MSRRKFLVRATTGAAGVFLVACQPPATPQPQPEVKPAEAEATKAPEPAQPTEAPPEPTMAAPESEQASIEFVMNDSPGWADAVNKMMAMYMEQNPKVQVKFTPVTWEQLQTAMPPRFAAKEPPDLILCDVFWPWVQQGMVVDLQPFVDRDGADLSKIADTKAGVIMGDPKRYGLPFDFTGSVVSYNKTLFEKYSVPLPKAGWTTDDLRSAAIKLTRDAADKSPEDSGFDPMNIKLYGMLLMNSNFWGGLVQSFGGSIWSDDGRTCTIDTPEALEAFTFFNEIACKQHALYGPQPTASAGAADPFVSQQAAIMFEGEWQLALYKDIQDFDWDVAAWQKGPRGEGQYGASDALGIAKDSKYVDAAWDFMKYWIWNRDAALTTGVIMPPALNDAGMDPSIMNARIGAKGPTMENLVWAYKNMRENAEGSLYYQSIHPEEWQPIWGEMLTTLLTLCTDDPQVLVPDTAKQITEILQKP